MRPSSFIVIGLICALGARAAEATVGHVIPREIGHRTVVLDFSLGKKDKPTSIELVSSEAAGLNPWAEHLIKTKKLTVSSPGVRKIAENRYRAVVSFPLEGDGAPLPPDLTPPMITFGPPHYPPALAKEGRPGGVLLKISVDEQANITRIAVVRASEKEFADSVLTSSQQWQCTSPAKKNGVPVPITVFQSVIFGVEDHSIAPWPWQMTPEPALLPELKITGAWAPLSGF
jgi:TonB family protein